MFNFLKSRRNEDRFSRLVDQFQEPVYWFVRRRVGNHDDAADVTQEVFIRAFKSLDSLRDEQSAKSWLFRIAVNETNRFLTDRHRAMTSLPDDLESQLVEEEYVDIENEAGLKFQKALETLTPRQREVFDLRYYQEMTYDEIAEALDANVTTMKTTFFAAKQKITDYILNN